MSQEILESLGYRLVLAQGGEEAVRQFLAHRDVISLVLLDVIMPKVDGPDAYERICQAKPGVPVIFTSGYSDQGALLKATATKGAAILQKPYSAGSWRAECANFWMRPEFSNPPISSSDGSQPCAKSSRKLRHLLRSFGRTRHPVIRSPHVCIGTH